MVVLYRHLYLDIAPKCLQPSTGSAEHGVFRFNAYRRADAAPPALPAELRAALQGPTTRRPRIYVTFGTVFNRSPALKAAARAAAQLGGTVVVTIGADGDLQYFADLGANVHVHRFLDQRAFLPYCDMVVSHGGAGTLLGAAAHGVPHLVLPQAADHFRNARAILSVDAGRTIEPVRQTVQDVSSSLSEMLGDGALIVGAQALAQEMVAMPDANAAAYKLERWQACARPASG